MVWVILNVIECLVRDKASISSHTGSAPVTHHTNNGSDVILRNQCPFTPQSSDPLTTSYNIMMIPDVTP